MFVLTLPPTPNPSRHSRPQAEGSTDNDHDKEKGKRLQLQTISYASINAFDHSVRSQSNNNSRSWTASELGVMQVLRLTPSRTNQKVPKPMR